MDSENNEEETLEEELKEKWLLEQEYLITKLELYDTEPWQKNKLVYSDGMELDGLGNNTYLRYVAGFDISFVKDTTLACSGLFVFDISNNMELVYQDIDQDLIEMKYPYMSGFLAYREAPPLLEKLEKLKEKKPHLYPQCIFVDGNGVLHERGFGLACHIGYFSNTPTIGCSKKLHRVKGIENNEEHKEKIRQFLNKGGDYFELKDGEEGKHQILGYCYRSTSDSKNPIYISIGNKISWKTCLWTVEKVISKYRVPEPIRLADFFTKEHIRKTMSAKSK